MALGKLAFEDHGQVAVRGARFFRPGMLLSAMLLLPANVVSR